jgi:hypothetical protein
MFRFIKRLLDLTAINTNVRLHDNKIEESKKHVPNNLIDVLSVRNTTRLGWTWANYNKPFSIVGKEQIRVEVIKIQQVNNGHVSEIVRDYNLYGGSYEPYLRSKGYNIRLKPHEIKDVESKYSSTQYDWETSGVNVVEVYQQAFLSKVEGKLRLRSIVRYADVTSPNHVQEKRYYHDNSEKLSIKDFMMREKLFVRNNSSGFEYLLTPKINISDDSPKNTILYDSR